MSEGLRLVDACRDRHFADMSRIHALGWHTTYKGAVPDDYLQQVITEDRWIPFFRENHRTGACHGLLLYRGQTAVSCLSYGPARTQAEDYAGWGELISFYTHPNEKGKGYGSRLMTQALKRLQAGGFTHCYVLVLRENRSARRFYAAHGFAWDGTHEEIPFPNNTFCVDLRYVRKL